MVHNSVMDFSDLILKLGESCLEHGQEIFVVPKDTYSGSAIHPALCSVGTGCYFTGLNWPGQEADYSSPSSAEVKNEWSCTSAPSICFHGTKNIFTFTLLLYGFGCSVYSEIISVCGATSFHI